MIRLCIVMNVPSPYQVEYLNYIAQHSRRVAVRAIYLCAGTLRQEWDMPEIRHEHQLFGGRYLGRMLVNLDLANIIRALEGGDSLYLIAGLSPFTFQILMRYLNFTRKDWIFWGEKPRLSLLPLRRILFSPLRRACGIVGYGQDAVQMYEQALGRRAHNLPYFSNLDRFLELPLRPDRGTQGPLRFLYSGSLIPRKGVDLLIRAFVHVKQWHSDITLHLLGHGPLMDSLNSMVPLSMRSDVKFEGAVSWRDLPQHYGCADIFVFPTRSDGWGLVVNEALASGLPVITTRNAGAARDLIEEGRNGFVGPVDDVAYLIEKMEFFCSHRPTIYEMGQSARESAREFTLQRGTERLERVLDAVLAER